MNIDLKKLEGIVGSNNLKNDIADCYIYGSDSSVHSGIASVIVRPTTIEHVQQIMRYANAELIPVIPRGSGSGMSGQAVPIKGGIVLDLKLMNRIIEIRPEDMLCKVEPGVVDDDLNRALKPYNLFYPPAPASSRVATIGGEIANNASGVRSVKYGATRDSVLGMKVVMANGDLVTLGSNTRVEASGYQLDRLMVGSEGTLGVIVEATMLLKPIPKFRCLGRASFDKLADAGDTISEIISSGALPSMLELMDNVAIVAVNTTLKMDLPDVEAIIMFEADGKIKETVDAEMTLMKKICEKHNGYEINASYDAGERTKLYAGRKKLFVALSRYQAGLSCTSLADDMAVPYSKMAECAQKIHEIAERNHVVMTAYGHCGSGCMHTKILMDPTKAEQWENAKKAVAEVYDYVRSVGGTTSAEHGIGLSKAPSWKKEKADSLKLLKAIKKALDPNNILNPGKMQDAPDDWVTATRLRYPVAEK
ncbi:FAD-binding oxidoreductase [candidate division WOR-3 bacterium]|nr:FAD-binding oxidoreductase [candidate division WOR-3 bacterium]